MELLKSATIKSVKIVGKTIEQESSLLKIVNLTAENRTFRPE
jgi:hypothetical protein